MSEPLVKTNKDGVIHHVTICRPEKRNALTAEMVHEIAAAVRAADDDPQVRAVIVAAEGPIFSAGIDITTLTALQMDTSGKNPARALRRLADQLQRSLNEIESVELPVIGAIQGQAVGLGLELALSFDLRVAAADCLLSIPESRMGLVADVGGTTRLCRTVGPSRAKDMLMTARPVDAEEAHRWGLVDRVAAPDELMATAVALAEQIAKNAPLAVGLAKLIVDQGDGLDKHTQMAIERWAQSLLITTGDVQEAAMAFLEKRPAEFKGR